MLNHPRNGFSVKHEQCRQWHKLSNNVLIEMAAFLPEPGVDGCSQVNPSCFEMCWARFRYPALYSLFDLQSQSARKLIRNPMATTGQHWSHSLIFSQPTLQLLRATSQLKNCAFFAQFINYFPLSSHGEFSRQIGRPLVRWMLDARNAQSTTNKSG